MLDTITVDQFASRMQKMSDNLDQDHSDVLRDCSFVILEGVEENFRNSQTSGGQKWPPRKDPGPTHPLLILSEDLMTAAIYGNINRVVGGDTLELGVSKATIPYAGVHQYGDPERNIAQREYLAMSEEVVDGCVDVVVEDVIGIIVEAL